MTRGPSSRALEVALHRYVVAVVLLLLGAMLGCAMLLAAAGGAAGAIAGAPLGPGGMVVGAAVGAGAAHAAAENYELREGTLQGKGAADEEIKRLKALLGQAQSAARAAEEGKSFLERWLVRAGWVAGGWLAFKYLFPWSRAARNLWGGILKLLQRGERGDGIRKIISSTGLAHTEKPWRSGKRSEGRS